MSRSRPFSIYLLKQGFNSGNSLKDDHRLDDVSREASLPQGAVLYVLDNSPMPPWWKEYFKITRNLLQVTKGAIIFIPVFDRWFAISFGHVHHHLKDVCYEYDFGLRVTLNSVTPRLKSADTLDPGSSRRQRTQFPIESDLTYFDFDRDSTIFRKLTGRVKEEYRDLFKQATGASNLKINVNVDLQGLVGICERLLGIYSKDDYKAIFPNIRNIEPVKDPEVIEKLNEKVLVALKEKDSGLNLIVPDLINYGEHIYSCFSGSGISELHDEVSIGNYYEYLEANRVNVQTLSIAALKTHGLDLTDINGSTLESYNLLKCLLFDTRLQADGDAYHLCEGDWYRADKAYIEKIKDFLDLYFEDICFLPYNHGTEGAYNQAVERNDRRYICLDRMNISPSGSSAVEPCDLYLSTTDKAHFCHVKISTRSALLSHLFNQGVNSIELIKLEKESREKLKELIKSRLNGNDEAGYLNPINQSKYKVIFVVITHKDKTKKSDNFPLFSQLSLMRSIKELKLMDVDVAYCFVADQSPKSSGRKKLRKVRSKKVGKVV